VLLGFQAVVLHMPPEHETGHPDPISRLWNRQQLSLLHAGKGTEPATTVIDYHSGLFVPNMVN
jgi:hypothetical protein